MKRISDQDLVKKFNSMYSSSNSRDIPFNLTLKKLRSLLTAKTCFYTGIHFKEGDPKLGRSMDRVESDKGYTDDNVVPCLVVVNSLKGCLNYRELLIILKGMNKHFKKHKKDAKLLANQRAAYEPVLPPKVKKVTSNQNVVIN